MGHNLNFMKLLIAASMIDNINNLSPNNPRTGKTLSQIIKLRTQTSEGKKGNLI